MVFATQKISEFLLTHTMEVFERELSQHLDAALTKTSLGAFSADLPGSWLSSQLNGNTQGASFVQVKSILFTLEMWLFFLNMQFTVSF